MLVEQAVSTRTGSCTDQQEQGRHPKPGSQKIELFLSIKYKMYQTQFLIP